MSIIPGFCAGFAGRSSYAGGGPSSSAFAFGVDTTTTTGSVTTATQFQLPIYSGGTYNFTVDWGDGSSDTITTWNAAAKTHTYATGGTYNISITGTLAGFRFANAGDKTKMRNVASWGNVTLGNLGEYFRGCTNMASIPTGLDLTGTTLFNAAFMFTGLTSLPADWQLSGMTTVIDAFRSAPLSSIPLFNYSSAIAADGMLRFTSLTALPTGMGSTLGAVVAGSFGGFSNFLGGVTINTTDYSRFLQEMEAANASSSLTFHGGASKYNDTNGATARAALGGRGWTITDGGPA